MPASKKQKTVRGPRLTLRERLRKFSFIRAVRLQYMIAQYQSRQFIARHITRKSKVTILFYPDLPTPHHTMYKVCCLLGYRMTNRPTEAADAVIAWQDQTHRCDDEVLRSIAAQRKVLNYEAMDISKRAVERVVQQTFGYGTFVDPTTHRGPLVEKSDANARHDGRVMEGPIPAAEVHPDKIYQLLVDNRISDSVVEDIRLGFFGDDLNYCVVKHYGIERRFADQAIGSQVSEASKVFTADEMARIRASCRAIGLDFGALDLARDRNSGLLHLLDMNATTSGPRVLHGRTKWQALGRMAESFERQIKQVISREKS